MQNGRFFVQPPVVLSPWIENMTIKNLKQDLHLLIECKIGGSPLSSQILSKELTKVGLAPLHPDFLHQQMLSFRQADQMYPLTVRMEMYKSGVFNVT